MRKFAAHGRQTSSSQRYGRTDPSPVIKVRTRYKFPFGDFETVHRGGVLSAEVRAGQNKYGDIEDAAVRLRNLMDKRHD